MKENTISITVDWNLKWDQGSLKNKIEEKLIEKASNKYLDDLDKGFAKKLEKLLHDQAFKIVKNINRFELDQCNKDGIKETISMEDYIVKKAIESLSIERDSYGREDSSNSDKRTIIEWVIKDTIERSDKEFMINLKKEISKIEQEYQLKLQEMVVKSLSPIYNKLVEKLQ